jgi:hypothetical protein
MGVRRWVKHFKDGNTNITYQLHCCQQRTDATECNKQEVHEFIRKNRRITFREIAAQLGVGHHAVQEMIEIMGYWKFCSRWVTSLITGTEEHKTAENCSPIHPTVRIGSLSLPLVRALERSPQRSQLWTNEAIQEAV